MSVGEGIGTTLVAGTSGFNAKITAVDGGPTRGSIETTHLGTTSTKSFIAASLYDAGEFSITVQHDPTISVPIDAVAETWTIDWGGSGSVWSFSGFLTDYSAGATISEELMEATFTVKATGPISGI